MDQQDDKDDKDTFGDVPHFEDLPKETLQKLTELGNIVNASPIGDTFEDDHILSFNAEISLADGTSCQVGAWWAGPDTYAAFKYFGDSPAARVEATRYITGQAKDALKELE